MRQEAGLCRSTDTLLYQIKKWDKPPPYFRWSGTHKHIPLIPKFVCLPISESQANSSALSSPHKPLDQNSRKGQQETTWSHAHRTFEAGVKGRAGIASRNPDSRMSPVPSPESRLRDEGR